MESSQPTELSKVFNDPSITQTGLKPVENRVEMSGCDIGISPGLKPVEKQCWNRFGMSGSDMCMSDVNIGMSEVDICMPKLSDVDIWHVRCRKVTGKPV